METILVTCHNLSIVKQFRSEPCSVDRGVEFVGREGPVLEYITTMTTLTINQKAMQLIKFRQPTRYQTMPGEAIVESKIFWKWMTS